MAPDTDNPTAFRRALLRWYRREARSMPWRGATDPYRILLSEVMLQQTQVETVIPYYNRFLKAFPTVQNLAAASQDRVLKLWEGLGYYSRGRNLHHTAQAIVADYAGRVPDRAEQLVTLPGVGRYTAAAVASIAFGRANAVLDGNVKRVLARLYAIEKPVNETATDKRLWALAECLLAPRAAGDFNQAMMELGATVCTPRSPDCPGCPVRRHCQADAEDMVHRLPVRVRKKKVPHHPIVAGAIKKNGRYLIGRRPASGLLGGLWEFPGGKVEPGETDPAALKREIREEVGLEVSIGRLIATVDHAYSHFRITLRLYACEPKDGPPKPLYHTKLKWIPRSHFDRHAFPAANRKLLEHL